MTAPVCSPAWMRWHMLDSRIPLADHIRDAVAYFTAKHGRCNCVRVGGVTADDTALSVAQGQHAGLRLVADPLVMARELELGWLAPEGGR